MSASWKQLLLQVLLLLVSCRHINTKTPGPTPPPLIPITRSSDLKTVVLKGEHHAEKVELLNPVDLTLECIWTGSQNKQPNITGLWRKDGVEIKNSQVTVQLDGEKYALSRMFNIIGEENLGIYSCVFASGAKVDFNLAVPELGEVRDKPIVSYVRDSAVMECKLDETKPKPNTWKWYKSNGTDKAQIAAEPHRYDIKNDEGKTKLLVHNLTEADSGRYYCGAVYPIGTGFGYMELKVITILEPLKPFIAIVVEVIILVAAILLYERSQSKKKDTEGDETNVQTNTLTQGENNESEGSSSMRQRKV